jgi:hypothetical protein
LQEYETLLKELKLEEFRKDKRNDLKKKMNSFDNLQNLSFIKELEFLKQLKDHEQITGIVYNNFPESDHDFRIFIEGVEFNLEFTSTGESEPNKILRESFSKIANELLKLIPDNKMLIVDLKTDRLLNAGGKMEEGHIFSLVVQKIKKILPIIKVKDNSFCTINANMGSPTQNLFEIRDIFKYHNDLGERLELLLTTSEGEEYLKSTPLSTFNNFPISSFGFCDAKSKLVTVHSESVYPSRAESLREKALLNQLEKRADSKITEKQLLGQENPILVIQFQDILFLGYSYRSGIFSNDYFVKIKERILDAFKKNPTSNNILGTILIEDSLINSKFIPNPNFTIQTDILSKIKLFSQID